MPIGKGDVIIMSCPEIFLNKNISKLDNDNLELLTTLAGEGRPVYFDEYVHGMRSEVGTLALLNRWGLGPLFGLLVLLGGLIFWRKRKIIGQPEDDHREMRTDTVDFVESVAQLYNRALYRRHAISLYYDNLVQAVSSSTGLRGDALNEKVFAMTGGIRIPSYSGRRDISGHEFHRLLSTINESFYKLESDKSLRKRKR